MDDPNALVSLSVPADARSIAIVRSVVASVASTLALTYDSVDDLRIAAAEACAMVLGDGPGGRLRIDLLPGDDALRLRVWRDGSADGVPLDRGGLAWRVIDGLTDGAELGEVDGNVSVDLLVRTVAE